MAFRTVTDLSADTTISLGGVNKKTGKKNPNEIEGYYLGSRRIEDRKKKSGESFIYVFQTPKGNVGVWGKTDLDRKMGEVLRGQMTRVAFDKMVPTPNGDMYKYKVEIDDENTIEVSPSSIFSPEPGGSGFGTSDDAYEEDEEQQAEAERIAAERKAKVQSLLNKSK